MVSRELEMGEQVVWIKGFVPRTVPKVLFPCAAVDFPVGVEVLDEADVTEVARVSTGVVRELDAEHFAIVEHGGSFWRPIIGARFGRNGTPTAEAMLAGNDDDNPLWAVARTHYRQSFDTSAPEAGARHARSDLSRDLAAALSEAARDIRIIGGTAHRTCVEPTWLVTMARHMSHAVLVQPFFGRPGSSRLAAWFSQGRYEDAVAFAGVIAAREGCEVDARGMIEPSGHFPPSFDDVRFAEDRMIALFAFGMRPLFGVVPDQVSELAAEARAASAHDRQHALALCEKVAGFVAAQPGPEAEALMSSATMALSQISYFRKNALFSSEDEDALDTFSPPGP